MSRCYICDGNSFTDAGVCRFCGSPWQSRLSPLERILQRTEPRQPWIDLDTFVVPALLEPPELKVTP